MSAEDQLQPGEEILYRAQVSRLTLAPWLAVVALGLGIAGASWFGYENVPGAMAGLGLAALAGIVLAWKEFLLRSHEYVLTNRRVIQQTGILNRRSVDSRLDKVNNIEHRQSLWGRILNYGDVEIETGSEQGITRFANISQPQEFKLAVASAVEQYRGERFPAAFPPAGPSGADRMRQLRALYDDGLISLEEYEFKRRQLLEEL